MRIDSFFMTKKKIYYCMSDHLFFCLENRFSNKNYMEAKSEILPLT